ncbi:PREDICTED: probable WRKY mRNAion [Prunus dulcis]|uniref:PREDICTED: probable WRKY mRNAion n=1 Tax=Prunus dulcis TaxID=3755 RepID=A0A5E4FBJ0_PRUDU|nr:probable WRKY transcription factor 69 isoform X1 [Prunus dulcis]VVA25276.1 PREDICTED: probable WRKY mRNAion [Prunus dulcis]
MDETLSPEPDSEVPKELRPEGQASKRRKVVHEKTVVTVKIGTNVGKLKNEGPPSDSWSWRKYGQKPIKGSPYPRGYYRCSTSKGCSAKKQVERSKTDASVLIITYTSSHNHPGPDVSTTNLTQLQPSTEDHNLPALLPKQEEQEEKQGKLEDHPAMKSDHEDHFHYIQSPIRSSQNIMIDQEEDPFLEKTHVSSTLGFLLDEEPLSYSQLMSFSTPKSEENDFFDELEELPTFSSFPSFMRSNLSLERIPSVPS